MAQYYISTLSQAFRQYRDVDGDLKYHWLVNIYINGKKLEEHLAEGIYSGKDELGCYAGLQPHELFAFLNG